MSPRIVLFIASATFFSGAERALLLTIRALDPARYRPIVLVGHDGELATQLRAEKYPTYHVPIVQSDWRHPMRWIDSLRTIAWLARRHNANILHANEVWSFQPVGYVGKVLRIPAVTHVRFVDNVASLAWLLKPGFSKALFVSRHLLNEATRMLPDTFAERSEVLYDGVELINLPPRPAWEDARRSLDLDPSTPVVAIDRAGCRNQRHLGFHRRSGFALPPRCRGDLCCSRR